MDFRMEKMSQHTKWIQPIQMNKNQAKLKKWYLKL